MQQVPAGAAAPERLVSRRLGLAGGALAASVLAVGLVWAATGSGDSAATAASADEPPTATTTVRRRDLVERETLDGTLGFADAQALATARPGTVTWLPREGSVVRRGRRLYEIDGRSTYLLYGSTPAWRSLSRSSADGADVRQLEENLVALGYDPEGDIEVDEDFDRATEAAVRRWERARGDRPDGVVELGEVVFLPGARRIGSQQAALGAQVAPGAELMETTSRRRVVTVKLEASRQGLLRRGDTVAVDLPDGSRVSGRVVDVGRVARTDPGEQGEEGEPYVEVTIQLLGRATGSLDEAPVDVSVARQVKRNALTVPVSALLALAGGGYAVEVEGASGRRLVRVETGAFADGYVEIRGKGIRAGTRVVVPR